MPRKLQTENEIVETVVEEPTPTFVADDLGDAIESGIEIPLPENLEELIEAADRPALEPGVYLAIIQDIAPKPSTDPSKESYGINVKLLINSNPESLIDGWDASARVIPQFSYVYMGKMRGGRLYETEKAFTLAAFIRAVDAPVTSALSTKAHLGKMVKVVIEHRSYNERMQLSVKTYQQYVKDGVVAPVYPGFEALSK